MLGAAGEEDGAPGVATAGLPVVVGVVDTLGLFGELGVVGPGVPAGGLPVV